ncbi:MAG: Rpn family recombination-promoting nuclease/putative transposase [Treponemataceae bacterium]|nr:Rpn family recombination-promoting nuclease/putative transposase [Treponemataceae bacterium]
MNEKKLTPEEKWEQATLANNFIFYKVMRHHPEACKHLIEILLKIKIDKMNMRSEETIELDYDAKGIRLDVLGKDTGRMYDVELQMTDTKELLERARYSHGVMDLDTLKTGQKYKELCDSHVIFICLEDVFHNGLPVSTFENICFEDGKEAGKQEKAVETALNMLKINLGTPQQISQITGLQLEEVQKLAEELVSAEA